MAVPLPVLAAVATISAGALTEEVAAGRDAGEEAEGSAEIGLGESQLPDLADIRAEDRTRAFGGPQCRPVTRGVAGPAGLNIDT